MEQLSLFAEPTAYGLAVAPLAEAIAIAIEPVVEAEPLRAAWPALDASVFDALGGEAGKFDANLEALGCLRSLQASGAEPGEAERIVLNRYTGWGGLPNAFLNTPWDTPLAERQQKLRAVLTPEEWESARASTPNAHYTSLGVIEALWKTVQRLGFQGGRVLEPSAGVGYFLGAMPTELVQRSEITAVELDAVSADLLKALYGPFGVKVRTGGFEEQDIPEGVFDLAISNVPFGNYQVADTRRVPYADFNIHDWFIARMIEAVRPGGLVVAITSAGTMDKAGTEARMHFAIHAELLGAVRLPSMAFKKIASTEVTTDVLIFQKRATPATEMPEWAGNPVVVRHGFPLRGEGVSWKEMWVNPFFADLDQPQRLIGKHTLKSNGYGLANACVFEGDEPAMLAALQAGLAAVQGQYAPRASQPARRVLQAVSGAGGVAPGSFVITDSGQVGQLVSSDTAEPLVGLPTKRVERIKGLIQVRDVARRLTEAQAHASDSVVAALRAELNAVYDAFVAKHDVIHARGNRLVFRADPDWPLLLSLELWDEEAQLAEKADIFRVRTVGAPVAITSCDTEEEALLVCLSQHGEVVPAVIAGLVGRGEQEVMEALASKGAVFRDPMRQGWVERGRYLSGNIREKLRFAEFAGEAFAGNVEALRAVMPAPIGPADIKVRLGAAWVPSSDYASFIKEVIGVEGEVSYCKPVALWRVSSVYERSVACRQTWGTDRAGAISLMEHAMNGRFPQVTDPDPNDPKGSRRVVNRKETLLAREKQEALKAAFVDWVWRCPERTQRLVDTYNATFNVFVDQVFDGSHLRLPGYSGALALRKHQLDGIWRILSSGVNTLLGHVVGAGKTLTAICAVMEARRIGYARKPAIVVPNNMLDQFAGEWLRAYPSARLLLVGDEDMEQANRKVFLNKVSTGNWDAVLMTHSMFERIPMAKHDVKFAIKGVILQIEQALSGEKDTRAVKALEKAKKMWQARMEKMAAFDSKDAVLTFDKLGVDMLVSDEAHLFKNLYRITRLRVPGVPTNDSRRAFDMWLKTRHVMAKRPDGAGVVFMTATPVSNSLGEVYTMQNYLQPDTLEALGVDTFDAWAATFGEVVSSLELAPDGSGYRMHERFCRFVNVPELLQAFKQVADIKTRDMLDLPTPEVERRTETIPSNTALKAYVETLVKRSEQIRNGKVTPDQDNMLVVTSDGRKAALDLRLVGLEQPPGGKVDRCVENILRIYQASASIRGTQLVFCDISTPSGGTWWNVYEEIRRKLCEAGVPAAEIAFIHDATSDAAKEKLYEAVREGRVRVLLGSSAKLGVGVNVQRRLVALHHLDAPWRPADVEQREGRIDRQGNLNDSVLISRYVTEGSFDAYMWQTLETKALYIAQAVTGNCTERSVEDVEMAALSYAEVKALASGNPQVIEKALVDTELVKLSLMRSRWLQNRAENQQRIASLPERLVQMEGRAAALQKDIATVQSALSAGPIAIETPRGRIEREKAIGEVLLLAIEQTPPGLASKIGKVAGLELLVRRPGVLARPVFELRGEGEYEAFEALKQGHRMLAHLQDFLAEGLLNRLQFMQSSIARSRQDLAELRAIVDAPFEQEARFIELSARKVELDEALGVSEGAVEVAEAA